MPTTENFFLRTAVAEESTGNIGAIEVPAEWIKPVTAQDDFASSH